MKRILLCLVAVLMLSSVFVVAASAEDNVLYYGDINADNTIDIRDLVAMQELLETGKADTNARCDCNHDNAATTDDLMLLKKHLLGVESIIQTLHPTDEDDGGFGELF